MKLTAADKLWRDLVKERDNWTCQWPGCGTYYPEGHRQGLHAHHIFGRGRGATKHVLLNGISLCMGHHVGSNGAHGNPLEFADMMRERLGSEQFDDLQQLSRTLKKRQAIA